MSAQVKVSVTVYCDGATHWPPLEGTLTNTTQAAIRDFVQRRGWSMNAKGQTFCREHGAR